MSERKAKSFLAARRARKEARFKASVESVVGLRALEVTWRGSCSPRAWGRLNAKAARAGKSLVRGQNARCFARDSARSCWSNPGKWAYFGPRTFYKRFLRLGLFEAHGKSSGQLAIMMAESAPRRKIFVRRPQTPQVFTKAGLLNPVGPRRAAKSQNQKQLEPRSAKKPTSRVSKTPLNPASGTKLCPKPRWNAFG